MAQYVISIDQGTTSTRCILFDDKGQYVDMVSKTLVQTHPKEGYVLMDAEAIMTSVYETLTQLLIKTKVGVNKIKGIGITNQRETTIVWDAKTGIPIYDAIVWQSQQTQAICDDLIKKGYQTMIHQKTGLIINPYFSGTKLKWILDHYDVNRTRARAKEILFGTVDSFILWHLTNKKIHATDYTNASRTMLFNINTLTYDQEILNCLDIPIEMLPSVKDSSGLFGYTDLNHIGMSATIPILSMVGDQQASLFGQQCFQKGDAKNTYGTGCFMLKNIGDKPILDNKGLLTTIAWKYKDTCVYALEGSTFSAGAAVSWLKDNLGILSSIEEIQILTEQVSSSEGVFVVPALVGLGTPYWDKACKASFLGLTAATHKGHIVRATLEAIAFQVKDVLSIMEQATKTPIKSLKTDGKAANNEVLLQFQADVLNCHIEKPDMVELTALGAAYLVYLALGIFKTTAELETIRVKSKSFKPVDDQINIQEHYKKWGHAVAITRLFK